MALITPSFITVNPNYTEPGIILPYSQASGAFETIAQGQPLVFSSQPGVQYVVATATSASNQATLTANYGGTTNGAATVTEPGAGSSAKGASPPIQKAACHPWAGIRREARNPPTTPPVAIPAPTPKSRSTQAR